MLIIETERLRIREMDADADGEFVFQLLNTPKFLRYIGDRGVRSVEAARDFIENRYRRSYREHGFGLYTVCLKPEKAIRASANNPPIGICGFVRREELEFPDIGFAFLPEYERHGFGFESASAVIEFGRRSLGFKEILAITSPGNVTSQRLLGKLGFVLEGPRSMPGGEELNIWLSQ